MVSPAIVVLLAFLAIGNSFAIQSQESPNDAISNLERRAMDPTSFAWVHRFAAIGDSFTAGIGAGSQLGSLFHGYEDWECSRYDRSYPMLVKSLIGPSLKDFQFPACSGDRSEQIYQQVENMEGNLNMVIMTAGGNDLCLASMIKKCVMLPYDGEETCAAIITKAQENINTILKPNLKDILRALKKKMAKDAVVIFNGYARFFNTDNEDCSTHQQWNMVRWLPQYWFSTPLTLTVDRRKNFNNLVVNINQAIRDSIIDISSELNYTIGFSNWDPWPIDGVNGQMCDPASTGDYPDPKQPNLQFFKPITRIVEHEELRRRGVQDASAPGSKVPKNTDGVDKRIYDSLLWNSANPKVDVVHRLDSRAPSPPDCPGDGDFDVLRGIGLPDTFGKLFHPNELGHETIASFAVAKAIDLRAKVLGLEAQTCEVTDVFKCWQKEGRKGYATASKMNENYKKFCDDVKQPEHTVGWKWEKTYFANTPDEQTFLLQLGANAAMFDKAECLSSFDRIINGCDGNDPENPMNWKYGGTWTKGEYTYEINIKRSNRPQKVKKADGFCKGDYNFIFSSYEIRGVGFSSYDFGQQTILPNTKGCLGLGVTAYNFEYFDGPDEDGLEWKVNFRTPIWVNARCFKNNKVMGASGGHTDGGCGGSDS